MINADMQAFFERNGINLNQVSANVDCRLYSGREINEIADQYGVRQTRREGEVCISDIMGYGTGHPNIFLSMSDFFDSRGDGYHRRSVGMLEYSTEEIMWRLTDSFEREPIIVDDMGEGKYMISQNGLHRYTLLRVHYLNELEKCQGDKEKELRVKEKYLIPVIISELDHIKTYSRFLLAKYGTNISSIKNHWNENYQYTGKMIVTYSDGKKVILDDNELIELLRENMAQALKQEDIRDLQKYFKYESFRKFVEENLQGIIEIPQIRGEGGVEYD